MHRRWSIRLPLQTGRVRTTALNTAPVVAPLVPAMESKPVLIEQAERPVRFGTRASNGLTRNVPDLKANILIVDDRPDKLLALEAVLSVLDQNLVQARSGKEALRHLLKQDFAVILLDVSMPSMDGFETAALIRQRPSSEHTPIIFITSIGNSENHISR